MLAIFKILFQHTSCSSFAGLSPYSYYYEYTKKIGVSNIVSDVINDLNLLNPDVHLSNSPY